MKGMRIGYVLDKISVGFGLLSGILLICIAVLGTYEVVMRYFFNSPTVWVLETTIYLAIASTFLALAYVLVEKAHVNVDFVVNHIPPRAVAVLEACTSLLGIVYLLVLDWESAKITYGLYQSWEVSPTVLKVPMFIPKPVG